MSLLNRVSNTYSFSPATSIPSLATKTILITGANAGLGLESALQLAHHAPARLILTARTRAKYDAAASTILKSAPDANLAFLELDLASFASIKAAADTFLRDHARLDILMLNAGIMGAPTGTTAEGYEVHFGTNHVGHALFAELLMPVLLKTAAEPGSDVRVVTLSSGAHMLAPGKGFLPDEVTGDMSGRHPYTRYGQSKMANVLWAKALARRVGDKGVLSVSVHPGRVATGLLDGYMKTGAVAGWFQQVYDFLVGVLSVEKGAWSQLWAATWERRDVKGGVYYAPVGVVEAGMDKRAKDEDLQGRLWEWTMAEFKKHGYV